MTLASCKEMCTANPVLILPGISRRQCMPAPITIPQVDVSPRCPVGTVHISTPGANSALKFINRNPKLIPESCKTAPFAEVAFYGSSPLECQTRESEAAMRFLARNAHLCNLSSGYNSLKQERVPVSPGVSTCSLSGDASVSSKSSSSDSSSSSRRSPSVFGTSYSGPGRIVGFHMSPRQIPSTCTWEGASPSSSNRASWAAATFLKRCGPSVLASCSATSVAPLPPPLPG
eukprot:CAMPEP_0169112622 /NCGR_PEP_ID=MMETSP1015-20121227/27740_1 /TAXON_ID=342587 /ORGANISM="Karlodinium micrum, Strain CCMP2283" /LENGTH=230 /DNA_ID=CAMNT_0009174685 /DNA_START=14 /DNA_END=706 /DNA_ORIENTATION=+